MAVLCLMRFEGRTFREATKKRLAENSDLRQTLGHKRGHDHSLPYRFLRRVTDEMFNEVLNAAATRVIFLKMSTGPDCF